MTALHYAAHVRSPSFFDPRTLRTLLDRVTDGLNRFPDHPDAQGAARFALAAEILLGLDG